MGACGGSYGGTTTSAVFYYRTDRANNTGEVVVKVYRADREPISVVEINPIGAWHANSTSYTPKLTAHLARFSDLVRFHWLGCTARFID